MGYSIGQVAEKCGISAYTLRYYDKEGLLPFVERSSGGIRMFRDSDFEWLQVIHCMKNAGMSIKDIRSYIQLAMQGNGTIDARLHMFEHQRDVLMTAIYDCVKGGKPLELVREPMETLIADLTKAGADYFILGCTELPIVQQELALSGAFIDPTAELAKAAIRFCGAQVRE